MIDMRLVQYEFSYSHTFRTYVRTIIVFDNLSVAVSTISFEQFRLLPYWIYVLFAYEIVVVVCLCEFCIRKMLEINIAHALPSHHSSVVVAVVVIVIGEQTSVTNVAAPYLDGIELLRLSADTPDCRLDIEPL